MLASRERQKTSVALTLHPALVETDVLLEERNDQGLRELTRREDRSTGLFSEIAFSRTSRCGVRGQGKVMWQLKHAGIVWLVLTAVSGIGLFPATAAAQSNPIVIENQQPGTSQWRIPWGSAATDAGGQIKGYASATSVKKGENITFYVSTNPAQTYTIDVYRIGWYQGLGGRLMQHIDTLSGVQQPTCATDAATGMVEGQWAAACTFAAQAPA